MDARRFVDAERARARARGEQRLALAAAIRSSLPRLVQGLIERGATRIVLFGSLLADRVDEASDVDVAVRGLPSEALFATLAWAQGVVGRPVDIVRLEEASPELTARIRDGEVLHDG